MRVVERLRPTSQLPFPEMETISCPSIRGRCRSVVSLAAWYRSSPWSNEKEMGDINYPRGMFLFNVVHKKLL
jgi:hypothetical protein